VTQSVEKNAHYQHLKSFVIDTTGMVFYADMDEELARIIDKRMDATGSEGYDDYLELLSGRKAARRELDELVSELTIGETHFFRHKEQIDAVRDVILPQLIEKNRAARRLRIWSAGCATGAEPYTLAIVLDNDFGVQLAGWTVEIIGSDINKKFLAHAQRGRFSEWALRNAPDDIRKNCFRPAGRQWDINPAFKKKVSFQHHNLVEAPFPSLLDNLFDFDLILCRNVTIYFERKITKKIIRQFHGSLADDGWLVVGHSEPDMKLFRAFRSVNAPGAVLYQKSDFVDETDSPAEPPPPPASLAVPPPAAT